MDPVDEPRPSRARRLATQVYDAHGSNRILWLDGPWWLAGIIVVAVGVVTFAPGHWKWLALPVLAAVGWIPAALHWGRGLWRSPRAFRDGFHGR